MSAALADRYEIERQIGVGGMATVYLARDLRHDRQVALKLLRPELGAVIGADRFLAEIKLTANLQHPHILPLFDSGEADGLLFYVMPYIQGVSLRDRLTHEKQIPVPEAIRIATEVASALDYAHRHGVIHRDIKPENILLHDGQALVADFGIALALSTAGSTRMTETGMSLGTPHYMSPEQAMGEREITGRSDVYALGAVLYEMLAGDPPFTGSTAQAIVARVLTEQPRPLVASRHTIPRHVEAAVFVALEKLPADRFATPAHFAEALKNPGSTFVTGSRGSAAASAARTWSRRDLMIGGTALAAVTALGFAGGWAINKDTSASPTISRFILATADDHRLTGSPLGTVAISPDGSTIVYVGRNSRGTQLYRRQLDELTIVPIPGTEGGQSPFFSPDGRWITFAATTGIKKVPIAGGAAVAVPSAALYPAGTVWLDMESMLLTGLDGRIHRVDTDGTTTIVAAPDSASGESALIVQDVIPGTQTVLAIAAPGAGVTGRAYAIDVKSGKRRLVVNQAISGVAYHAGYLAWVDADGTLLAAEFDAGDMRVRGTPVALAQGVRISVGGPPQFAVSRTGTLVYVPQTPFSLMLVGRDGKAEPIADVERRFHSPRFSPEGGRIAMDFTVAGSRDVWMLDLRDKTLTRLTFDNDGHDPVWTPDGRRIAYATARGGVIGMFLRNADGSGVAESLFVGPTARTVGAFYPASDRALALVTGVAGSFDLVTTPLAAGDRTGQPLLATTFNEFYPDVSPDGRWLAYASDESGQSEVYVRPLAGGAKTLVSQNGGSEPMWSTAGGELYYRGFGENGVPLIAVRLQTEPDLRVISRTTLFDVSDYEASNPHSNYDIGPDGRFVMVYQGRLSKIVVVQNWPEEVRRRGGTAKK